MTVYTCITKGSSSYRSPGMETVIEPSYNILSYTWGRFEARDSSTGSALSVSGIHWDIPAIDPAKAFDAERFQNVLQLAAGRNDFVWVDVACIDQTKGCEEKYDQIGKQIGIFHRAQTAFIWLHQLSTRALQFGINAVSEAKDAESATKDQVRSIEAMSKDPWFSSLWTLQEAYLRKSAILLSDDGSAVFTPSGNLATLQWLVDACSYPWAQSTAYLNNIVQTAGLRRLSARNAVVLLAAARFRTTSRPLDRLYGIMQIFGLKVGKARIPNFKEDDDDPTRSLLELELQLSQELNKRSPALSQTFVHVDRALDDEAWCLRVGAFLPAKRSRQGTYLRPGLDLTQLVPHDFFNAREIQDYEKRARISFTHGTPTFDGLSVPFESLLAAWEGELPKAQPPPDLDAWMPYMNDLTHSIYMDNVSHIHGMNKVNRVPSEFSKFDRPLIVATDLAALFPGRLRVLLLGRLRDGAREVFMGTIAIENRTGERSMPPQWCRVGICTWIPDLDGLEEFTCGLG